MTFVLAIDPGPTASQFVLWDGQRVLERAHLENADMMQHLSRLSAGAEVCFEKVASFGMPVGEEVFETVFWTGRFFQAARDEGRSVHRLTRQAVKLHLCNSARAKDANIRQALIDRFGGKDAAIGRKATPGPLYGVSSHAWAALALAITFADTQPPATN